MTDIGKLILVLGVLLTLVGGIIILLTKAGFRGLPGDISHQGQHLRFYFPIVTCIVISVAMSAIFWIWNWLSHR